MRNWIGAAAALVLALGCGGVLSTHPVGGEPVRLVAEQWEGTWIGDDGPLEIRVSDAAAGRLELGWIESGVAGFELETATIELRRLDDWTIGSLHPGIDPADEHFLWMRVERDGDRLLAWMPDAEEFGRLIGEGALPGRVEDGEVILARLEPRHLARIRDESGGPLFVWDEPMLLRRLAP